MEIDALVNVKHILEKEKISKTDIMLLKSALNNHGVDINLSIQDNLDIIYSETDKVEFMDYLNEFVDSNSLFMNTPIYLLLLNNSNLKSIILMAIKKNLLSQDVICSILKLEFNDLFIKEDDAETLVFINEVLSSSKIEFTGESLSDIDIINFIVNNLGSLLVKDSQDNIAYIKKNIIIKLFSLGIIDFSSLKASNCSFVELLSAIIYSLLSTGEYYHIMSIVNERTIDTESKKIIKDILEDAVYTEYSDFDGSKFVREILAKLKSIGKKERALVLN